MTEAIKYIAEYGSLYGLIAFLAFCALLVVGFVLIYKANPNIAKLLSKYDDIHAKVQRKNILIEVDLHKNKELRAE